MEVIYRPGRLEDSRSVYEIFLQTIMDLSQRLGVQAISGGDDPKVLEKLWIRRRSLMEHLAASASQFWIAEVDGQIVGYARAIQRGEMHELTEFFVLPEGQGKGIGRELLQRAYPLIPGSTGVIIATQDTRALARYMKHGHTPRFPAVFFQREPLYAPIDSDLGFYPLQGKDWERGALDEIDRRILGHTRAVDHAWLQSDRQGYLYLRDGQPVGYGYQSDSNGPYALLEASDFPAVLAFAEAEAYGQYERVGFEVPLVNQQAVQHLLQRGYKMDGFFTLLLSTRPFGQFENYIYTGPPYFF